MVYVSRHLNITFVYKIGNGKINDLDTKFNVVYLRFSEVKEIHID